MRPLLRRPLLGLLGWAASAVAAPAPLLAQQAAPSYRWGVGLGAGVVVPTGGYSSTDNPGPSALMYFSYTPLPALSLGLDVGGMWTPHKASGHTELSEVLVAAVWHLGQRASSPRPFLLASIGAVAVDTDNPSQGRLAFGGGGGIALGRGDTRAFAEARFMQVQASGATLHLARCTVGMRFLWSPRG